MVVTPDAVVGEGLRFGRWRLLCCAQKVAHSSLLEVNMQLLPHCLEETADLLVRFVDPGIYFIGTKSVFKA